MPEALGLAAGVLLLVGAAFAAIVWPPFWRRVAADPRARDGAGRPTRFLRVHAVLIGTALVLALAQAIVGVWWLAVR
ncbi:hypothetical protein OVA14_02660 [Agrococcus sp. SL85]|uniref:SCO4848 family membrane protein n=1 Tax=Agrococcus sp. SL85 TaxID=2995141 RepID=UPI00226C8C59|nr:hypothetical protein [Agrococcus sp. SL85]WAC66696.1 hypothetical protein OVA14_02660 [Agrococcus sp. SL85]